MTAKRELEALLTTLHTASAALPRPQARSGVWREQLTKGDPALTTADVPLAAAASLLLYLANRQEETSLLPQQAEQIVAAYFDDQPIDVYWRQLGIQPAKGNVYTHLACQAALARTAETVAGAVSLAEWKDYHCPVCGAVPVFACLERDNGKRTLVCGACLTRWRYKRIGCAFCGEERPIHLRILAADDFRGWSVAACLTCRGYLKTADLRQFTAMPDWRRAALDTLPLDYAIQKWLVDAPA